jgi:hypothetical protein
MSNERTSKLTQLRKQCQTTWFGDVGVVGEAAKEVRREAYEAYEAVKARMQESEAAWAVKKSEAYEAFNTAWEVESEVRKAYEAAESSHDSEAAQAVGDTTAGDLEVTTPQATQVRRSSSVGLINVFATTLVMTNVIIFCSRVVLESIFS